MRQQRHIAMREVPRRLDQKIASSPKRSAAIAPDTQIAWIPGRESPAAAT
jgi:hypothetical protein